MKQFYGAMIGPNAFPVCVGPMRHIGNSIYELRYDNRTQEKMPIELFSVYKIQYSGAYDIRSFFDADAAARAMDMWHAIEPLNFITMAPNSSLRMHWTDEDSDFELRGDPDILLRLPAPALA